MGQGLPHCGTDGSDNRLHVGKFLFQIIEATRGGMPARGGNRSPRDDRSWGSRAKDFVICAEAALRGKKGDQYPLNNSSLEVWSVRSCRARSLSVRCCFSRLGEHSVLGDDPEGAASSSLRCERSAARRHSSHSSLRRICRGTTATPGATDHVRLIKRGLVYPGACGASQRSLHRDPDAAASYQPLKA
eukprot:COSAG01_NODE_1138_length_11546_cov_11.035206_4_plen_188_part_00